jgi:hypothetical protein
MFHVYVECLETKDGVFAGPHWAQEWFIVIYPATVAGLHMTTKRICRVDFMEADFVGGTTWKRAFSTMEFSSQFPASLLTPRYYVTLQQLATNAADSVLDPIVVALVDSGISIGVEGVSFST